MLWTTRAYLVHLEKTMVNCQPLPPELDNPVTAWPYLRRRFPWLFNDDSEASPPTPAAAMGGQVEQDVVKFAVYMLQDTNYTLADIAESLTGKREYGGAAYTRVKAVRDFLENTTTTPEISLQDDFGAVVAA